MFDIFAIFDKTINTEYVTYSNFITSLIGIFSILAIIGAPLMQSLFKRFDKVDNQFNKQDEEIKKLREDNIELKTLLKLTLLREGISFEEQEKAVQKAKEELSHKSNK